MKAVQIQPDASVTVGDLPRPRIGRDEVLLRTIGCGVCGTDVLKMNLRLLRAPTVLGHELVGEVVEAGPALRGFALGDTVVVAHHVPCGDCHFCRHGNDSMCQVFKATNLDPGGFAEFVRVSAVHLAHTAFKLPPSMPWQEAIFTEPLACCVRNVGRLPLLAGDSAVVVGLGSIGLMTAALLERIAVTVIGLDLDAARRAEAPKYGVDRVFEAPGADFRATLARMTDNRGADAVVFTAGPGTLLNTSLDWLRDGGCVNLFSHLSGETAAIDTAKLYHREIQLITTYSSSPQSLKQAFAILAEGDINLRQMIAPAYAPASLAQAVADINARKILKAVIQFG